MNLSSDAKEVKPLVSVNMITYNHELFIAQAIDGVINQKINFPIELVIGEDCSTDKTREIVLDYQRKFPDIIKVIISDNNVGMLCNSFRTTKACVGKYIAYCEGDDYWHNPNKLQMQVDFLENNPDYVLVHSYYDTTTANFSRNKQPYVVPLNLHLDDANAFDDILMRVRKIATLTVCAKSDVVFDVIENNSECFDSRYIFGDLQLWLEISRYGKVKFISESLATYRFLPESASNSNDQSKNLHFELNVQSLIEHYIAKYNCDHEVVKLAKSIHSLNVLVAAQKLGDKKIVKKERENIKLLGVAKKLGFFNYIIYLSSFNVVNRYLVAAILKMRKMTIKYYSINK